MNWQEWIVGAVFFWALWTLFRVLWPKKDAGCATGDCACGPNEVKSKSRFSFNK